MNGAQIEEFRRRFGRGGKSICSCGHLGDGAESEHEDTYQDGHGACMVEGCRCRQFTWVRWRPEAEEFIRQATRGGISEQER